MISSSLETTGHPHIPGVVGFLAKPVHHADLRNAITAALTGRSVPAQRQRQL